MYLINFFMLRKKTPARIAKQRLTVIISKKKLENNNIPDYLPELKRDLIEVICKYAHIHTKTISMNFEKKNNNTSILELNIILHHETTQKIKNKNVT